MKKPVIIILAIIVIAGGAYLIFHKSSKPAPAKSSQAAGQQQSKTPATAPDVHNNVLITKTDSKLGKYLADPSGRPLYTYNGDTQGVSNCTGSCLQAWPAYTDKGSTSDLPADVGTIKRKDNGQTQYTYNGLPLYFFISDSPGKVTGNGMENFTVAKPVMPSPPSSH